MHTTRRKTGFIGFLVAIKSTKLIFHRLVEAEEAPLKYLLTYKLSQDHLELFFGAVRSAGGFNNNPTTQQFTAAYKRLLLRSHIEGGNGNCEKRDPIDILTAVTDTYNDKKDAFNTNTITNAALIRRYDLAQRNPVHADHDYCDSPNLVFHRYQNSRKLQFPTLLAMLQRKWRNNLSVKIVPVHLDLKAMYQFHHS